MPCRIVIPERIVVDIRIAIPRLRALRLLGDERVGLGKAAEGRVIPAGVVKVQTELGGVAVLTGVLIAGGGAAPSITRFTPGFVAQFGDEVAAGVGGQGGGAQVVAQEVVERAVDAQGDALCAGVVVFGDGAAALLIVVADEEGRLTVDGGLYAVAIAVVGKSGL